VTSPPKTFRTHAGISSLCTVFRANLAPCWEEGIPRHYVHRLCQPVVVDAQGRLSPDVDPHLAVVMGLERLSPLLPQMEDDLQRLQERPYESLYLMLPVGEPGTSARPRLLEEVAKLCLELVAADDPILVVAISHRRRIGASTVIRHYPVALFDREGGLLWAHPAGHSYGLIRSGFPRHQRVRTLGPRIRKPSSLYGLTRLDRATGLPVWYRNAQEHLIQTQGVETPSFEATIELQAECLLQWAIAADAEQALREATNQYLRGFETFFGCGGLNPIPGLVELL